MLSGGLDSATVAAIARSEGYALAALSFSYGQRHAEELEAARRVAHALEISDHRIVALDLRAIGGSALTAEIPVPKDTLPRHFDVGSRQVVDVGAVPIPVTYVPARNTIFLAIALGLAEALGAFDIFFGANALDYSGYPDCRPEFVSAFEGLANIATKAAVEGRGRFRIRSPLLHLSKADIIRKGMALGVDYSLTRSCYDPNEGRACGRCDACILRRRGFEEANVSDPTLYA